MQRSTITLIKPAALISVLISIIFCNSLFSQYDDGKSNIVINTVTSDDYIARKSIKLVKNSKALKGFHAEIKSDIYYEPLPSRVVEGNAPFGYDKNFIFTRVFRNTVGDAAVFKESLESTNEMVVEKVQYFDGLGRPIQSIDFKASPTGKDIVTPVYYDDHGQETRKYLPYTVNNDGSFRNIDLNSSNELETFYNSAGMLEGLDMTDSRPYSKTTLDGSPLNRVVSEQGPGDLWNSTNRKNNYEYGTNNASFPVIKWIIDATGNVSYNATQKNYPNGKLFRVTITDENLNRSSVFKDLDGNVIMKETELSATEKVQTYYVYDNKGLLCYVITPEGVKTLGAGNMTTTIINTWCYVYKYDTRRRMVYKKLPGVEPVYMVYDKRDRISLTQDGNLRKDRNGNDLRKWSYVKYDNFNRTVITGIYTHATIVNQAQMQDYIDHLQSPVNETRSNLNFSTQHGYTNVVFPTSGCEILTVTWYDDHDFDRNGTDDKTIINDGLGSVEWTLSKRGMQTGSKTKIIGSSPAVYIENASFFDMYGNVIQQQKSQPVDNTTAVDRISFKYNLLGELLTSKTTHVVGTKTRTIVDNYVADQRGRIKEIRKNIDSQGDKIIVQNTYNELGSLIDERLGVTQENYLQKLDYKYNIRGWLSSINNNYNSSENDLFSFKLFYTTFLSELNNNQPQYNGNISSVKWINKSLTNWKAYGFNYDKLNRLKNAEYGEYNTSNIYLGSEQDNFDEKNINYDLNGNITKLDRRGYITANPANGFGDIDQLTYSYNGNMLTSVNDQLGAVTDRGDFSDKAETNAEYAYDFNGNMYRDDNKGITDIVYNYLNLPEKVSFNSTNYILFNYDATGIKIKKTIYKNNVKTQTEFYNGAFIYKTTGTNSLNASSDLQYIVAEKGRIVPNGFLYNYEYYIRDHLGNTRVVFSDGDGNGFIEADDILQYADYYPFGMLHGRSSTLADDNKMLYNGKEIQSDGFDLNNNGSTDVLFDWYDYGARQYDPQIGRWLSPDPLCELTRRLSPYNFCRNNPIRYIDPDGMYSTEEWKRDNGITDNDLITIYKAPEEKKNENNDANDPQDPTKTTEEKKKIAIDPGHGDKNDKNKQIDPGAVNGSDYEKDIVLNIANTINTILAQKGYTITMTRTADKDNAGEKLKWRIDAADGTDIFVSIHVNSSESKTASGFSVCYKNGNAESKSLAQSILDQNTLFTSRGLSERSDLYVLNNYSGTAVLVEAGFISNATDLNIMKTNSTQIGTEIATGIINYLTK